MHTEVVLKAIKATEAHWQEKCTATIVTHDAERCAASVKFEKSDHNEAMQRPPAIRAGKASALLQKCMKKLMTK